MTVGTTKRLPDRGERFWGAVLDTASTVDYLFIHHCPVAKWK